MYKYEPCELAKPKNIGTKNENMGTQYVRKNVRKFYHDINELFCKYITLI